jgi:CrcB protein
MPSRARLGVLALIAVGGALGAPARYEIAQLVHVPKDGFPWATFWTNLSGAFVLGLFVTLIVERFPPGLHVRAFVATGFLGAYTTFSTMAVEADLLVKDGRAGVGIWYLVVSVAAGLVVCFVGVRVARAVPVRSRA